MTEIRFVLAPEQNQFFFELADALRFELEELGLPSSIGTRGFDEPTADRVFVLLPPHEYFVLEGSASPPPPAALRRTIFISAEQPESIHFHQNVSLAPRAGALFDINSRAVRAYRRRGLRAEHLRLGYTRFWDRFERDPSPGRSSDVLFLGAHTERRVRIIAECEPVLSRVRSRLVFSDNSRPNPAGSSSFLAGERKWDALRASRWLLNVHQGAEPYFEWHRILQAVHCGTAVITETSADHAPLQPSIHFAAAPAAGLPAKLAEVLEDEEARKRLARDAYTLIREEIPLRDAAERLAGAAERLGAGAAGRSSPRAAIAARAAGARVRLAARRATRAPAAAQRGQPALPLRGRPAEPPGGAAVTPAIALGVEGAELGALLDDLPEEAESVLLVGEGQTVTAAGLRRLEEALAGDGAPAFSFGLVASDRAIGNPFGWAPGREVQPPVLVRARALRRALAERAEGEDLDAALARAGEGRNAQAFVARDPAEP